MENNELILNVKINLNEEKFDKLIEREVNKYIKERLEISQFKKMLQKLRKEMRQMVIDEVNIWRNK